MAEFSRRDLIKIVRNGFLYLSGALALGGLLRFLEFQTEPAPITVFELGPAENYPVGSRTVITQVPALLIHSQSGFSALSLVCTHLGCTLETKADGFACPCHGSRFDNSGNVMQGPASQALHALRVELRTQDDMLLIHTD